MQILENRNRPSFREQLGAGLLRGGMGLGEGIAGLFQAREQKEGLQGLYGEEKGGYLAKLTPDDRKLAMQPKMGFGAQMDINPEAESYLINLLGKEGYEAFKLMGRGGQTKMLSTAYQMHERGVNFAEEMRKGNVKLSQFADQENIPMNERGDGIGYEGQYTPYALDSEKDVAPKYVPGKGLPKDFKLGKDYFLERDKYENFNDFSKKRSEARQQNQKMFEEVRSDRPRRREMEREIEALVNLVNSDQLPDSVYERALINPKTGEFYGFAKLAGLQTPAAQRFEKIIARFQSGAKDYYGARVTNFDLESYMKQFPSLMNTKEGRMQIAKMLQISQQARNLYDKALEDVYRKYGTNKLDPVKVDELVESLISDDLAELERRFLEIDEQNMQMQEGPQEEVAESVSFVGPDGKEFKLQEGFTLDQDEEGNFIVIDEQGNRYPMPPQYRLKK